MRTEIIKPAYGKHRTVRKFLWTSMMIEVKQDNGDTKYLRRWLEHATWEEKWTKGKLVDFWKKLRWLDLEEK